MCKKKADEENNPSVTHNTTNGSTSAFQNVNMAYKSDRRLPAHNPMMTHHRPGDKSVYKPPTYNDSQSYMSYARIHDSPMASMYR